MDKLICIVGETGSGKDTLARHLEKEYGLKKVVSYTTRPIRQGETDGVEHHFITDEEMQEILKTDIIAYTKIEDKKSGSGVKGYEYCATRESIKDSKVYIIDYAGVLYFREHHPDIDTVVVLLDVPETERRGRLVRRGDDASAVDARISNEQAQFQDMRNLKDYDYKLGVSGSKGILNNTHKIHKIIVENGFIHG